MTLTSEELDSIAAALAARLEESQRPARPSPYWSTPRALKAWAQVFHVTEDNMRRLIDAEIVESRRLSPRRIQLALHDIPGK